MKIVVVGAGKVGYSLAQRLAQDQHDVYVIEKNGDRIKNLENNLDVNLVQGNGSSIALLQEIGIEDIGMLIAVTDSDEVNMLACMLGKAAGIPKTIARVRDTEYENGTNAVIRDRLGIDLFINPEMVTAQEIYKVLKTPAALDVEDFASGAVRLVEFKIRNNLHVTGIPLRKLELPPNVLIVGIMRGSDMIIPHGKSTLEYLDNVFFLGAKESIDKVEVWLNEVSRPTQRVVIIGAGLIGRHLTLLLEADGYDVKVIEKDLDRCEQLAALVSRSIVIHGDGTDVDLLQAEEISDNDVIICLTDDDKLNLLVALLAKHLGVPKTFVRVGRLEYITLMEQVGIDVVFSPRLLTSGQILRLIREGENLINISTFEGSKAEAIEISITNRSNLMNQYLKDLKFPGKSLVGAVVRDNRTIVPKGDTQLLEGDHIVIFTLPEYVNKLLTYVGG
ncbi:Trk system potassium transporter TrkA [Veillonella sp. oral taxon 780]|uniref:Trk system potassium transporter TrkA n=1 Tax=Veillonella sp. oral taxon 780 TaxID=671229 RepID=UPI00021A2823|nr:Trk system potassium transporter TrkA [Veillonella sp. oral taxon 780]EGS33426.1 potassium transporter peripheral membrane component [Veillonella sp. oral taxon 780 str. F0422]